MNWIDEAMSPFKGGGASSSTHGAEPTKRRGSHFGGFSIKESIKKFGAHEDELDKDLDDMKRRSEKLAQEEDALDVELEEEIALQADIQKQLEEFEHMASLVSHQKKWEAALRIVRDAAFEGTETVPALLHTIMEELLDGENLTPQDHCGTVLLLHPTRHGHLYVAASTEAAIKRSNRCKEDCEWSPVSHNELTVAAYHVLQTGQAELSFRTDQHHFSIAPLQEKNGRTFGVLLSGPPPVPDEWLLAMAKLAGPMVEMVWRREQLNTVIKVAQAWIHDYANDERKSKPIKFMAGHATPGHGHGAKRKSTKHVNHGAGLMNKTLQQEGTGKGSNTGGSNKAAAHEPHKKGAAPAAAGKKGSTHATSHKKSVQPKHSPRNSNSSSISADHEGENVQEQLYGSKLQALWIEPGSRMFREELEAGRTPAKAWQGRDLNAFGTIGGEQDDDVVLDQQMENVRIVVKNANGLVAGIFKVQSLIRHKHLEFHMVNTLFSITAPALQQAVNQVGTMHIGEAPPANRLGGDAGNSQEAAAQLELPRKLQSQMRMQLAKVDVHALVQELHSYKDPPEDVHKVVRSVLALLGHGESASHEHNLADWDQCRVFCTQKLIKEMQTFDVIVTNEKLHTEERWKESERITKGVDAESVFTRFPHGVKVMLQWLEAGRLVHRMATQVAAEEKRRKIMFREGAAAVVQGAKRGKDAREGIKALLAKARSNIRERNDEAERKAEEMREWRQNMTDFTATEKMERPDHVLTHAGSRGNLQGATGKGKAAAESKASKAADAMAKAADPKHDVHKRDSVHGKEPAKLPERRKESMGFGSTSRK